MKDHKQTAHLLSAEIKTEILQIAQAFDLGPLERLLTFEHSGEWILTEFQTRAGIFEHYYRIKQDHHAE